MKRCNRCKCSLGPYAEGDECTNRGWCELNAASLADATEEEWFIAAAIGELSRLDDERRARTANAG